MIPSKIERRPPDVLMITYVNEPEYRLSGAFMRRNCPCALCREERGDGAAHAKPLTAAPAKPASLKVIEHTLDESSRIEQVWSIGNYAIGIRFGDGHDDGIYSWPYLRTLAASALSAPSAA